MQSELQAAQLASECQGRELSTARTQYKLLEIKYEQLETEFEQLQSASVEVTSVMDVH